MNSTDLSEQSYYKHKYGGIYCYLYDAIYKNNTSDEIVAVYQHIYPFDKKIYVRNKDDFMKNNILLSKVQLELELSKPKEEFQKEIMNKKHNLNNT